MDSCTLLLCFSAVLGYVMDVADHAGRQHCLSSHLQGTEAPQGGTAPD